MEQLPRRPAQLGLERLVAQLRHDGGALQRVGLDRDVVDGLVGEGDGGGAPWACASAAREGDVEEGGDGEGEEERHEQAPVGDGARRGHGGHGGALGGNGGVARVRLGNRRQWGLIMRVRRVSRMIVG